VPNKKIIKNKTLRASCLFAIVLALPLISRAGVLDQLMNAADEALVTYGRDAVSVGRENLPLEVVSDIGQCAGNIKGWRHSGN